MPGSPLDPRAQGCNQLIRDGATLVQSAADVLEAIRPIDARDGPRSPASDFDGAAAGRCRRRRPPRASTDLLGPVPVAIDELIRQSGLPPAIVADGAARTRTGGRLERHAGGQGEPDMTETRMRLAVPRRSDLRRDPAVAVVCPRSDVAALAPR